MNHLDERLHRAAGELRAAARQSLRPEISGEQKVNRPWVAFALGFAAVALLLGAGPLLWRQTDAGPPAGSDPITAPTVVTSVATTAGMSSVISQCSAAGRDEPAPQPGLPEPVAAARAGIATAAIACDYEAMRELAHPSITTSFGGGGFDNLLVWKEQGEDRLDILVGLLATPYAVQEIEGYETIYVWPSAFVYDTWDEIPTEDLQALLTVYTEGELDEISTFGAYAGWRIGITESGRWIFYVAGD